MNIQTIQRQNRLNYPAIDLKTPSELQALFDKYSQMPHLQFFIKHAISSVPADAAIAQRVKLFYMEVMPGESSLEVDPFVLDLLAKMYLDSALFRVFSRLIANPTFSRNFFGKEGKIRDWIRAHPEELRQVKIADLSGLNLTYLPEELFLCTEIEQLELKNNQLTYVDPKINSFTKLKALSLSRNRLKTLPKELSEIPGLEIIHASQCQLTSVPSEIYQMQTLKALILSNNLLTSLPIEIDLPNLEACTMSYNQLPSIPDSLSNSRNLKFLFLDHNQIKTIPDSIENLQALETFHLSNNFLSTIPENLSNLLNLTQFTLNNNPIRNIPSELCRTPNATIYREIQPYLSRCQRSLIKVADLVDRIEEIARFVPVFIKYNPGI